MKMDLVWGFADVANGFMALPNLIAILALSGVVASATRKYFKEYREGKHRSGMD
jgi:AGCS family alanine or glycine:cation symporter